MELAEPLGRWTRMLLAKRGLSDEAGIKAFLYPEYYQPTSPQELPGMAETVDKLLAAIRRGDEICVYGDYDADGVTATTVLVAMLRSIGAKVRYHVPDRFAEGYGMNAGVIRRLAAEGVKLLLTCDCGISNLVEVELAKTLGLEVLITDHHQLPQELPQADTLVNPQLLPEGHKARYLPGVGVAYMLTKECYSRLGLTGAECFLDLVALGIVADVVPLLKENRYLLQLGLERLRNTTRPGLQELMQVCKLHPPAISEEDIGYQLVPRLNAAGRIASAALAVELLLCTDTARGQQLAKELDEINHRRRNLGDAIYEEALAMVEQEQSFACLVLYQPHWHHGVIGIIAGRLAELYQVPVLLMSLQADGVTVTGSARSIPGVHIFQALQRCGDFLTKYGGHAGAAGFSLRQEKLELFRKAVIRELEGAMAEAIRETGQSYDLEIGLEEIDLTTYRELMPLGPFGEGNPTPLFYTRNLQVLSQRPTANEKHLHLVLGNDKTSVQSIWWWGGGEQPGERVDAVYSLKLNKWLGRENLQLVIVRLTKNTALEQIPRAQRLELKLIDLRRPYALGQPIPNFAKPLFFTENMRNSLGITVRDRYHMENCECLVLFSLPPSLRTLQEMLALSRPKKLVLAYAVRELEQDKEFLQQLLGMIKFAVARQSGEIELPALAVATGQMESSIMAALNFLQAKGLINFQHDGPESLCFARGDGIVKSGLAETEARLRSLLAETRAFRRYLLKSGPENILQLIYGSLTTPGDLGAKK